MVVSKEKKWMVMFGRVQKGEPFLKTGATFGNQLMEKTWQVHAYGENRRKRENLLCWSTLYKMGTFVCNFFNEVIIFLLWKKPSIQMVSGKLKTYTKICFSTKDVQSSILTRRALQTRRLANPADKRKRRSTTHLYFD